MEKKSQSQSLKNHYKVNLTSKKGPCIRAFFFVDGAHIEKVSLVESPQFSVHIYGNPSLNLKQLIENWIESYLLNNPLPVLELISLDHLTTFKQKILKSLSQVSFGKTLSYSKLAELAGHHGAARAAGGACKNNPWPLLIPCHRILPQNQTLGQYRGGSEIKKRLLQFEKAFFKPSLAKLN